MTKIKLREFIITNLIESKGETVGSRTYLVLKTTAIIVSPN